MQFSRNYDVSIGATPCRYGELSRLDPRCVRFFILVFVIGRHCRSTFHTEVQDVALDHLDPRDAPVAP